MKTFAPFLGGILSLASASVAFALPSVSIPTYSNSSVSGLGTWWLEGAPSSAGVTVGFATSTPSKTGRGYFTFDLTPIQAPVTFAYIQLQEVPLISPDEFETLQLWDVSTNPALLGTFGIRNPVIFADLGSGTPLGSVDVKVGATGFYNIFLNPAGLAAINATRGGLLSVGINMSTLSANPTQDEYFAARGPDYATLIVTVIPEPSTFAVAATSVICFLGIRRRR